MESCSPAESPAPCGSGPPSQADCPSRGTASFRRPPRNTPQTSPDPHPLSCAGSAGHWVEGVRQVWEDHCPGLGAGALESSQGVSGGHARNLAELSPLGNSFSGPRIPAPSRSLFPLSRYERSTSSASHPPLFLRCHRPSCWSQGLPFPSSRSLQRRARESCLGKAVTPLLRAKTPSKGPGIVTPHPPRRRVREWMGPGRSATI